MIVIKPKTKYWPIVSECFVKPIAFVPVARGLGLNSQAGQIRHGVANGLPPSKNFFERQGGCVAAGPMTWRWASQTRYTLWCNTVTIQ